MAITSDTVYVLHTRPYRENSALIDLFSKQHGLFRAVFRGSKKAQKLMMFGESEAAWLGRGELKTISLLESVKPPRFLQGEKLFSALYVNELLVRLLHHSEPQETLYQAYQILLNGLADTGALTETVLREFEFTLLEELGYGYQFDLDTETGMSVEAELFYRFEPEQGICRDEAVRTKDKANNRIAGKHLLAISAGQYFDPDVRFAAKKITRLALGLLLGDKPLKSRELFLPRKAINRKPGANNRH